jgi:F-type H+-transporting ATPase subunit epsilon
MEQKTSMNLKILLPFQIFAEKTDISSIVAETSNGSLGILPHRLDFAAVLTPGILIYNTEAEGEVFLAVDEGVLIKIGMNVIISVRNAIGGKDLAQLREAVEREFINQNLQEQNVSSVMSVIEIDFMNRIKEFQNEQKNR